MAFKKQAFKTQAQAFPATTEQVANAEYVKQGKDVKVIAGAGSGKSSSLRYIASQVPDKNLLVLCFNKANAEESNCHAERPENIFYATINSIAYGKVVDVVYRKKLSFLSYMDLERYAIADTVRLSYEDNIAATKSIINAITAYCRGDKESVTDVVSDYLYYWHGADSKNPDKSKDFTPNQIDWLTQIAERYWNNIINKHNSASMSHDVYLKLFQLAEYKIEEYYCKQSKRYIKVDILALDESQDTSPVCENIFRNQEHLQRIVVGDPMQQLYLWRQASDIMSLPYYDSFTTGYLSQSFRFNQAIADKANYVLGKAGSKLRLRGSGKKDTITSRAILCRTNATVVEELLALMVAKPQAKLFTSIDLKDTFSKLYHMEAAFFDSVPKYPCKELMHIVDKKSLLQAIEMSDDIARLHKLRQSLVGEGQTLTQVKKELEEKLVTSMEEADIVVSTIHKSKGLEWSHVTIADDFVAYEDGDDAEEIQEKIWDSHVLLCLLYVAITRSEVELIVPWYLEDVLGDSNVEYYEDEDGLEKEWEEDL